MSQVHLPLFPATVTQINSVLAFEARDGRVTYFNGLTPVFTHAVDDLQTFRLITSQFCTNGNCTQPEIVRAFGVPLSTVKRYCAVYQKEGPRGFYAPRAVRGAAVLTAPVLEEAQKLLNEDHSIAEVAKQLGIKQNTLEKAVRAKRLHARKKKPKRQ
jgi:transposase